MEVQWAESSSGCSCWLVVVLVPVSCFVAPCVSLQQEASGPVYLGVGGVVLISCLRTPGVKIVRFCPIGLLRVSLRIRTAAFGSSRNMEVLPNGGKCVPAVLCP